MQCIPVKRTPPAPPLPPVGMKTVGIGRENCPTTSVFIFLFGNGNENGKARSGKRNRLFGISETVQFDRKHVDNDRETVLRNGNNKSYNPLIRSTQHKEYN